MEFKIPDNLSGRQSLLVEKEHTAKFLGSGSVEVLATPMMIALMENTALEAVQSYLPEEWTTVGTKVEVEHLRPTPSGEEVQAEALLVEKKDRQLVFFVTAFDRKGVIGQGSHSRYIINKQNFLSKLKS
ncbi:MAG: dihydrolipoamide acyltransferase [Candidatus Aminicenantes bacterium]|nr:dihydrolipoamide acyltransferase [Candidatus Aminicenantes bacterium]